MNSAVQVALSDQGKISIPVSKQLILVYSVEHGS